MAKCLCLDENAPDVVCSAQNWWKQNTTNLLTRATLVKEIEL